MYIIYIHIYIYIYIYILCFISSTSCYMNKPIGNGNPYNILHIVFASFYSIFFVLEGITVEIQLHCVIPLIKL